MQSLNVPFREKDIAKSLGARWDRDNATWYVPAGVDLTPFSKWLPLDAAASHPPSRRPHVRDRGPLPQVPTWMSPKALPSPGCSPVSPLRSRLPTAKRYYLKLSERPPTATSPPPAADSSRFESSTASSPSSNAPPAPRSLQASRFSCARGLCSAFHRWELRSVVMVLHVKSSPPRKKDCRS